MATVALGTKHDWLSAKIVNALSDEEFADLLQELDEAERKVWTSDDLRQSVAESQQDAVAGRVQPFNRESIERVLAGVEAIAKREAATKPS